MRPASAIAAIMRSGRMPLASGESVKVTMGVLQERPGFPAIQTLKMRTFTGYPMAALTERAQGNISMTYPVVI